MTNNRRENRGRELAQRVTIERVGRLWRVPSQTNAREYWVDIEHESCTCPEYEFTEQPCKHVHCVYYAIAWGRADVANDEQPVTPAPAPAPYWVHERDVFEQLSRDLCAGIVEPLPPEEPSRPGLSLRAAAFSAILKTYAELSNRGVQTDLRACAEGGRLTDVGHLNSISAFLGDEASTPLLQTMIMESGAPLHLVEEVRLATDSIDSSGASTVTYERWFGGRPWIKLRLAMGTSTHAVVFAKVSYEDDCPSLPQAVDGPRERLQIGQVSRDRPDISVRSSEVLESFGITPYIPFQDSAVMNLRSDAWSRYLGAFLFDRERFLPHYHPRSTVEAVISILKQKFGSAASSRRPIAQINETLTKVVAHNLCATAKAIFVAGLAPRLSPGTPMLTLVR